MNESDRLIIIKNISSYWSEKMMSIQQAAAAMQAIELICEYELEFIVDNHRTFSLVIEGEDPFAGVSFPYHVHSGK